MVMESQTNHSGTKERPLFAPNPQFEIQSDENDMNTDKKKEPRIVPKAIQPKITDPSPAGE